MHWVMSRTRRTISGPTDRPPLHVKTRVCHGDHRLPHLGSRAVGLQSDPPTGLPCTGLRACQFMFACSRPRMCMVPVRSRRSLYDESVVHRSTPVSRETWSVIAHHREPPSREGRPHGALVTCRCATRFTCALRTGIPARSRHSLDEHAAVPRSTPVHVKHTSAIDRHLYSPAARVCSESPRCALHGDQRTADACAIVAVRKDAAAVRSNAWRAITGSPINACFTWNTRRSSPTTALRDYRPEPIVFSLHDAIHALRTGMPFVRRPHSR